MSLQRFFKAYSEGLFGLTQRLSLSPPSLPTASEISYQTAFVLCFKLISPDHEIFEDTLRMKE